MSISQQPSFTPNEYVTRWLFHTSGEESQDFKEPSTYPQRTRFHDATGLRPRSSAPSNGDRQRASIPVQHGTHIPSPDEDPSKRLPVIHPVVGKSAIEAQMNSTAGKRDRVHHQKQSRYRQVPSVDAEQLQQAKTQIDLLDSSHVSASRYNTSGAPCVVKDPSNSIFHASPNQNAKPDNKYERRPRHKTRADKYEVKAELKQHKPKHRCRKKHGATLNHEFRASNVPTDRLTLRPNSGPGLFHKGKASSSVQRKGLPDLTFSEMTFLNQKRRPDGLIDPRVNDLNDPKKCINKASMKEVSGYFARTLNDETGCHLSIEPQPLPYGTIRRPSTSPSKARSASVGIGQPFGMVYNSSRLRARSNTTSCPHISREAARREHEMQAQRYTSNVEPNAVNQQVSEKASSSYHTWSVTPPRGGQTSHEREEVAQLRLRHKPSQAYPGSEPEREKVQVPDAMTEVQIESSVSNKSLDRLTKTMLFEGFQGAGNRLHSHKSQKVYYTLEDLKELALLSNLEATTKEVVQSPLLDQNYAEGVRSTNDNEDRGLSSSQQIGICPFDKCRCFPSNTKGSIQPALPGQGTSLGDGGFSQAPRMKYTHSAPPDEIDSLLSNKRQRRQPPGPEELRFSPGTVSWLLESNQASSHPRPRLSCGRRDQIDEFERPEMVFVRDSVLNQSPAEHLPHAFHDESPSIQMNTPLLMSPVLPFGGASETAQPQDSLLDLRHSSLSIDHLLFGNSYDLTHDIDSAHQDTNVFSLGRESSIVRPWQVDHAKAQLTDRKVDLKAADWHAKAGGIESLSYPKVPLEQYQQLTVDQDEHGIQASREWFREEDAGIRRGDGSPITAEAVVEENFTGFSRPHLLY